MKNCLKPLAGTAIVLTTLLAGCSKAPDVVTTHEQELDWNNLQGPVVVNYFAEWCAPCLRELPELNEFYHQDIESISNLQLVGVSFDPLDNQQIKALAERHSIDYPLALAQPTAKFPFERPKMLPATYVIFADGRVKGPMMGEQTLTSLREAVKQ
jgi:thiol-disulfide isomerase/thioredoxin